MGPAPSVVVAIPSWLPACTWLATMRWTLLWTFGFDTVYAMVDRADDARIGVGSNARSLGHHSLTVVAACYGLMLICLSSTAFLADVGSVW